jgi:hypothetical protein
VPHIRLTTLVEYKEIVRDSLVNCELLFTSVRAFAPAIKTSYFLSMPWCSPSKQRCLCLLNAYELR